MLAFLVKAHSVLAPNMHVHITFELLTGPRGKRGSDSETSTQTARIGVKPGIDESKPNLSG